MISYYVLDSETLLEMLEKARDGDDPSMIIMEIYANSDVEEVEGNGG